MKPHVFLRNTFLLLWLGLSASTLFEHQVDDFLQHRQPLIQDRQSANGFVATTGVTDTGVQPRLEIRDLEKNTDMLNIFLLGLQRFMQTNQSEKLSYYQIAGSCTYFIGDLQRTLTLFQRHPWQALHTLG